MKLKKAKKLMNGLYIIHWKTKGTSVAAVGRDRAGNPWHAPANWVVGVPCFKWKAIESVSRIPELDLFKLAKKSGRF